MGLLHGGKLTKAQPIEDPARQHEFSRSSWSSDGSADGTHLFQCQWAFIIDNVLGPRQKTSDLREPDRTGHLLYKGCDASRFQYPANLASDADAIHVSH